jgi:hypothetical protein
MTDAGSYDPIGTAQVMAEALKRTLDMAGALASSGRAVDLTGVGQQVGLLCAKSLDLPPDEGRRMRPELIGLSCRLEALSRLLAAKVAPPG